MIDATARDIREMRTHSSSVVARKAAEALLSISEQEVQTAAELLQSLERNSRILRQANPSHAWLQSSQREIVEQVRIADPESPEAATDVLRSAVTEVVKSIDKATDAAANKARSLLAEDQTILTHDYSTTVLATVEQFTAGGHSLSLIVTESRPRQMGRRMARTLGTIEGVDVTLVVDSAAGVMLESCDRVLVGMDCIVDGSVYNRVGTLPIAAVAARHDVPVTVTGADAKVIDDAFVFENDYRDPVEVIREPAPEFEVANPAYDRTPLELIDTIATDQGIQRL